MISTNDSTRLTCSTMTRFAGSSVFLCSVLLSACSFSEQSVFLARAQTTPTPAPNACDEIEAGDISFTYVHARDPDEVVLFTFTDIPADLKLYLTDNAWTGDFFEASEGTLELTVPAEGIAQGKNFGYGPNTNLGSEWVPVEGAFALDPNGEQVFLYCIGATELIPLAAFSGRGPFVESGLDSYELTESALPERLAINGSIALPRPCGTWEYAGVRNAEVNRLKTAVNNINNWKGEKCLGDSGAAPSWSFLLSPILVGLTVSAISLL